MAEIVLGCQPCIEQVAISGDESAVTETALAAERMRGGRFPRALSVNDSWRWFINSGLTNCPVTGDPCPHGGLINDVAEFMLLDIRLELLDQATSVGQQGLAYLIPETKV